MASNTQSPTAPSVSEWFDLPLAPEAAAEFVSALLSGRRLRGMVQSVDQNGGRVSEYFTLDHAVVGDGWFWAIGGRFSATFGDKGSYFVASDGVFGLYRDPMADTPRDGFFPRTSLLIDLGRFACMRLQHFGPHRPLPDPLDPDEFVGHVEAGASFRMAFVDDEGLWNVHPVNLYSHETESRRIVVRSPWAHYPLFFRQGGRGAMERLRGALPKGGMSPIEAEPFFAAWIADSNGAAERALYAGGRVEGLRISSDRGDVGPVMPQQPQDPAGGSEALIRSVLDGGVYVTLMVPDPGVTTNCAEHLEGFYLENFVIAGDLLWGTARALGYHPGVSNIGSEYCYSSSDLFCGFTPAGDKMLLMSKIRYWRNEFRLVRYRTLLWEFSNGSVSADSKVEALCVHRNISVAMEDEDGIWVMHPVEMVQSRPDGGVTLFVTDTTYPYFFREGLAGLGDLVAAVGGELKSGSGVMCTVKRGPAVYSISTDGTYKQVDAHGRDRQGRYRRLRVFADTEG